MPLQPLYNVIIRLGIIPTQWLSVAQHFYGMCNSNAAVKRPLLVDYMKPCGQERVGNMNALWNRMATNNTMWENVLPKSEVKSHIFETFKGKFIYSLAHKQAI